MFRLLFCHHIHWVTPIYCTAICAVALAQQLSCLIQAAALTPHFDTAAFMLSPVFADWAWLSHADSSMLHLSWIHTATIMQQHICHNSHAATFFAAAFSCCSDIAAFTLQCIFAAGGQRLLRAHTIFTCIICSPTGTTTTHQKTPRFKHNPSPYQENLKISPAQPSPAQPLHPPAALSSARKVVCES